MKKNEVILRSLYMAKHGFSIATELKNFPDFKQEAEIIYYSVCSLLDDFEQNGEFTKEDY